VDKGQVLRHLGCRDWHQAQAISREMDRLVDRMIAECEELITPRYVWEITGLTFAGQHVEAGGLALPGKDIEAHLQGARSAALLAVTLGGEVDRAIRRYEVRDMTRAVILDAAAGQAVEEACDLVQAEIGKMADRNGLWTGARFSPGYGDFPLEIQPDFLRRLDAARKIGLACTPTLILTPRKSVTAVIGLFPQPVERCGENCMYCNQSQDCPYRRS